MGRFQVPSFETLQLAECSLVARSSRTVMKASGYRRNRSKDCSSSRLHARPSLELSHRLSALSKNHPTQSSKARFAPPRRYTLRRVLVTAIGAVCVALVAVAVAGLAAIRTRVTERQQAPQAARDALNAIKQLHARTDVGVTRAQYVEAVAKASVEVKTFEESSEGKKHPDFASLLSGIIGEYKAATQSWGSENMASLRWIEAAIRIKEAESLLDERLRRSRDPRIVAIESELDSVFARFWDLSCEMDRLTDEAETVRRQARFTGAVESIDALRRIGDINAGSRAIASQFPAIQERINELYAERQRLLFGSGGLNSSGK